MKRFFHTFLAFMVSSLMTIALLVGPAETAPSFEGLGIVPGGDPPSYANSVSADGNVVVGYGNASYYFGAFRWTQEGGMVGLGFLRPSGMDPGSSANGVSADGNVVVGGSTSVYDDGLPSPNEAFRWTQEGGMVGLGYLPGGGYQSSATGVSSDGSVVVGQANSAFGWEAFRWTQEGGMVALGELPGGNFYSGASDVSADGNVVVGMSSTDSGSEAFRWTQDGGMVGLGDLPGGKYQSNAYGVSADGNVVVGYGFSDSGREAFRWTQDGGMVGLGDLDGGSFGSFASGVSADGSVVVGEGFSDSGAEAFIWDETNGLRNLKYVLETVYGLDLTDWTLVCASDISDDGLTIVGYGRRYDEWGYSEVLAWRATLVPLPGTLLLLGTGLFGLGALGWRRRKSQ